MNRQELVEKIVQSARLICPVPPEVSLDENTCFLRDLYADSYALIELCATLSQELGQDIPDTALSLEMTIGQLADYVLALKR